MDWVWLLIASFIIYIGIIIFVRVFDFEEDIGEVDDSMAGKSIIVTGATSGIGRQIALYMAARGASVTLACRDIKKGEDLAIYIRSQTANKYLDVAHLDLEDFDSVRAFAKRTQRCHCLINNAGMISAESIYIDDIELTMRTNHLGPFLLTNLLLPVLIETSEKFHTECRILFMGSRLEKRADVSKDDLTWMREGPAVYDKWIAYGNSKLCTLLTAAELTRRLPSICSGKHSNARLTVNTVSPGMVNTNLNRFMPRWQRILFAPFAFLCMRSPAQGADSVVFATISGDLTGVSGQFISNRKFIKPSDKAHDVELMAKVWQQSERLVKLKSE